MPYCLYLRKSRADLELEAKGEMETLARHEKILLELAARQKLPVTKVYKELVSGETIAARPVMQQLLEEVEDGQWTGVLVMEVERLARGDTIDQGVVARSFKLGDTKIVTPVKTYDPNNEFDEEYFEFGLFMSRREYKTINRRIQRGRVQSAKDGKFLGSTAPYGYDKVRIEGDKGYTLRPNGEADTVRAIFDMYLKGAGCSVIARRLDELHAPTRTGGSWSKSSILDILKNPVYTGKIRWSYKVPKKGGTGDSRVINDNHILVDGLHEALIDEDTYDKAQTITSRSARRPVKKDLTLKNPLTGLGFCAKCGSLLTRLGPNKHCPYDTIKCSNRYCDNVSAPMELVEREVVRLTLEMLRSYQIAIADNSPDTDIDITGSALRDLDAQLAKVEKQIAATYDFLESGVYTVDTFTARQKSLSDKKTELEVSRERLRAEIEQSSKAEEQRLALPGMVDLLEGYYYVDDAKIRNDMLRLVINRFTYEKNEPNRRGSRDRLNFDIMVYPCIPSPRE